MYLCHPAVYATCIHKAPTHALRRRAASSCFMTQNLVASSILLSVHSTRTELWGISRMNDKKCLQSRAQRQVSPHLLEVSAARRTRRACPHVTARHDLFILWYRCCNSWRYPLCCNSQTLGRGRHRSNTESQSNACCCKSTACL